MKVDLPGDVAQFIEGLVAAGEYPSANQAVAAGVRLLMERQQLRAEIQQGLHELDAGQGIDGKLVFAELRKRLEGLARPSK